MRRASAVVRGVENEEKSSAENSNQSSEIGTSFCQTESISMHLPRLRSFEEQRSLEQINLTSSLFFNI